MTPLRLAILPALLLTALGGCAVYEPRHVSVGSTYVDPHVQDQQIRAQRQLRKEKAREWRETAEIGRRERFARYFE